MKIDTLTRQAVRHFETEAEPSPPSGEPAEMPRILDPSDPLATARRFVADEFTPDGKQLIFHHRGEFFTWSRTNYERCDDADMRVRLYEFCENSMTKDGNGLKPFKPSIRKIADIIDALRSAAHLPTNIEPPVWLEEVADLPPSDLLSCVNGLLYLPEMRVLGHDPAYFNASALPVAFNPGAPRPREWHSFLSSLWPDEPDAIACLQEIFGYLLTSDTRQHKIFSIVGPRRSGKGTIARILTALLGRENVVSPSLVSLGQRFGLAPLIRKRLGIMADARLTGRTDTAGVLEALLNISGEDSVTIDRKHREPWTGKLPTRFLLLSNELPRLADNSGAFAGRFVLLTLKHSFYGQEDIGLEERLRGDLAGILKWSLEGLQQIQERGRFQLPASSAEVVRELEDLSSPVGAFVRERCHVAPGHESDTGEMFSAWRQWCEAQGRKPGTRQTFGRDLRAAVPGLATKQVRDAMRRARIYEGIALE